MCLFYCLISRSGVLVRQILESNVTVDNLFPSFEPGQIPTELQGEVFDLTQAIAIPFAAEPNARYANWWRSLHEAGHWAINPEWYNHSTAATGTISIYGGQPSDAVRALSPTVDAANFVSYYAAGNDVIPDIRMFGRTDPMPAERETRAWSIGTMLAKGWEHPFRTILRNAMPPQEMEARGDDGWHKAATAHVWSPTSMLRRKAIEYMGRFDINPLIGNYRPVDIDFEFPHDDPQSITELNANFDTMIAAHPSKRVAVSNPEAIGLNAAYGNVYMEWKMFFNGRTPKGEYERLLDALDTVSEGSLAVFNREWPKVAAEYGHGESAEKAADLASTQQFSFTGISEV